MVLAVPEKRWISCSDLLYGCDRNPINHNMFFYSRPISIEIRSGIGSCCRAPYIGSNSHACWIVGIIRGGRRNFFKRTAHTHTAFKNRDGDFNFDKPVPVIPEMGDAFQTGAICKIAVLVVREAERT